MEILGHFGIDRGTSADKHAERGAEAAMNLAEKELAQVEAQEGHAKTVDAQHSPEQPAGNGGFFLK